MSIIRRDPAADPPKNEGRVVIALCDYRGRIYEGVYYANGPHTKALVYVMEFDESFPWTQVTAWAPAEWTAAPTTDPARRSPEEVATIVDGLKAAFNPAVEEWKKVGDIDAELARMRGDDRDVYVAELVERATQAEEKYARMHDCGQETVCARPPACMRHWSERCAKLSIERNAVESGARAMQEMRDRAIEERDALGLQLAALRDQNNLMAAALKEIADSRDNYVAFGMMAFPRVPAIASAALTHGVDVEKKAGE